MFRKLILASLFLVLAYGFWLSPDFKMLAAGASIFLFGMLVLEDGFKSFAGGLLLVCAPLQPDCKPNPRASPESLL